MGRGTGGGAYWGGLGGLGVGWGGVGRGGEGVGHLDGREDAPQAVGDRLRGRDMFRHLRSQLADEL